MAPAIRVALSEAVLRILRPLVRVLLRHGIPYGAFAELAQRAYVEVAAREFGIPGRKQTDSRVATLTGLTRKRVAELKALPPGVAGDASERYNRAARVIGGWTRDPLYGDPKRGPSPLPLEGEGPTFSDLVRRYSGDVPVRAVLDELLRVGAAAREGDRVRLLARAYIPRGGQPEMLAILGADVADLISTIDHNLAGGPEPAFFQRKVAYDNLDPLVLPEARRLGAERGQTLLEELDRLLSAHDRDVGASGGGEGGRRAGWAVYYFEDGSGGEEDEER